MRVAITGASGFIGAALLERHRLQGDSVRVLSRASRHWPEGVEAHMADLADAAAAGALQRFADGADVLYHCAGDYRDESRMEALHCDGTQRLIDAASGRTGRWVQLSSVGAYGSHREGVVTEDT